MMGSNLQVILFNLLQVEEGNVEYKVGDRNFCSANRVCLLRRKTSWKLNFNLANGEKLRPFLIKLIFLKFSLDQLMFFDVLLNCPILLSKKTNCSPFDSSLIKVYCIIIIIICYVLLLTHHTSRSTPNFETKASKWMEVKLWWHACVWEVEHANNFTEDLSCITFIFKNRFECQLCSIILQC